MSYAVSFFALAIRFATVFLFGATGEIINQKSGHLNMGTPGIMYLGAIGGIIGERIYLNSIAGGPLNPFAIIVIPIVFAALFGAAGGLLFSFFTVTLRCNQNVTGLTLTTFAVGLSCLLIGNMDKSRMAEVGQSIQHAFPGYSNAGWFGEIFLSHSWFTYLGVVVAIAAAIIIKYTRVGLNLRAVGENASAADSAGINVSAYRYVATVIGGAISGIGGVFYELDYATGSFSVADGIDAFGWLALCIVIFSLWKPMLAIGASFLFACLSVAPSAFSDILSGGGAYTIYIVKMAPYLATILVLLLESIITKKDHAPANLGISYFREDR